MYRGKKSLKNAHKYERKLNFKKVSFSYLKDSSTQKLHSQVKRQTETKLNTEDILSGFQEFSLQPIIKKKSNSSEMRTETKTIIKTKNNNNSNMLNH